MPPRKENKKQGSSNNSNKPSKGTLNQLNKKRKVSEMEDNPNKTSKINQSAFKILSSKMKGGKQTCSKHLQEKCADTSCTNPHYTIVNVIEENQFKDSIKKYNGCNDAMSKTLGDENQEAVIMEIIMRKVRKDELEKLLISPKDHLYYSMGVQGASTQQLNVIRNLRNKIQGSENRTKMFHTNEDSSQDELAASLKIITANHIFKCQLESNTKGNMETEEQQTTKEDLLKAIEQKFNEQVKQTNLAIQSTFQQILGTKEPIFSSGTLKMSSTQPSPILQTMSPHANSQSYSASSRNNLGYTSQVRDSNTKM